MCMAWRDNPLEVDYRNQATHKSSMPMHTAWNRK
jgi:hypothetical protein